MAVFLFLCLCGCATFYFFYINECTKKKNIVDDSAFDKWNKTLHGRSNDYNFNIGTLDKTNDQKEGIKSSREKRGSPSSGQPPAILGTPFDRTYQLPQTKVDRMRIMQKAAKISSKRQFVKEKNSHIGSPSSHGERKRLGKLLNSPLHSSAHQNNQKSDEQKHRSANNNNIHEDFTYENFENNVGSKSRPAYFDNPLHSPKT